MASSEGDDRVARTPGEDLPYQLADTDGSAVEPVHEERVEPRASERSPV
jgi:hypothetical protein